MAMTKPSSGPRRRSRRSRKPVLAIGLLLAVLLFAFWPRLNGYAVAGASVGARGACSCRYLGGRELSDCRKDFEPGMWPVILSEDSTAKSVTATVPPLSRQTATFREGEGCLLEPWTD